MPRKTARTGPVSATSSGGFNEAAARCRGKPSMRRPGTTTRRSCFNEAAARCRGKPWRTRGPPGARRWASMRPRPDAAENQGRLLFGRPGRDCFNEAAARCRGKPRAHRPRRCEPTRFNEAAARCRGKPLPSTPRPGTTSRRFNEAAARCRGKPRCRSVEARSLGDASMRPRPDAAENHLRQPLRAGRGYPLQ